MPINSDLISGKENKEKGKERVERRTPTETGEMATKENAEIRTTKDPGTTIMDKPTLKIRIEKKGKEMQKGSKEKAKEKASHDTAIERKITTREAIKTMKPNPQPTMCRRFTLKTAIALVTTRQQSSSHRTSQGSWSLRWSAIDTTSRRVGRDSHPLAG